MRYVAVARHHGGNTFLAPTTSHIIFLRFCGGFTGEETHGDAYVIGSDGWAAISDNCGSCPVSSQIFVWGFEQPEILKKLQICRWMSGTHTQTMLKLTEATRGPRENHERGLT
jgi:hypothetical protein